MNKSRQIKQEYIHLKDKVEERIKQLQSKLTPHQISNSKNNDEKQTYSCQHNHCHHNYLHNCCHYYHNHHTPSNFYEYKNNQHMNNHHFNSGKVLSNQLISQALVKSQQNQKQISDKIKLISQKIENISISQNKSHLSEQFSQTAIRHNNICKQKKQYFPQDKNRCHSQIKKENKSIDNQTSRSITKDQILIKKIKNKPRGQYQNTNDSNIIKSKDKNKLKSKSKSKKIKNFQSEYCLSLCPIHQKDKILNKKSQKTEVYIDSEYRNRKHEKNHLIESFKQQERSKKKLISKIVMNAFNQYGKR